MHASLSRWLSQQPAGAATAAGRQRLLTRGLDLVHGTALAPKPYERFLLDQFVRGNLTIDQALAHLEAQEYE
ncbi:hypothetical protein ACFQT0_29995 [Hymenobacter humi]|uniref:Antitoxin VbhA domain-containing protein n=1 Tax=Hymenobacter humi TaxID=1411620 RepID=A0ABW2UEB1_9BACT